MSIEIISAAQQNAVLQADTWVGQSALDCKIMDVQSAIEAAQSALRREAYEEAEKLLLPFAEEGNVETQSLLGMAYQIQGKFGSAISWLRKAAEAGNGCAAHNLGIVYLTSPGPNPEVGKQWLQLAYDLGFEAQVATDQLWFKK